MPIYSETIDDDSILRILGKKYERVLIIGCGACMNESLAVRYSMPIYKESPNTPYATVHELQRIRELLATQGYQVETKYYNNINGFYCMTNIETDQFPLDWIMQPEIILVLSCTSGCEGLRDRLPTQKIVRITRLIGGLPYCFSDENEIRAIVKEDTEVLPLKKEQFYAEV